MSLGNIDVAKAIVRAVPLVQRAALPRLPRLVIAVRSRGQVGREVQFAKGNGVIAG